MSQKLLEKHQALLGAIPLFAGLDEHELVKVGTVAQVRSFPARAVVVTQGEPALALFVIIRGRLKVVSCAPDGRDTVLVIMGEREIALGIIQNLFDWQARRTAVDG